jgi:hypothetical protein
MPSKRHPLRPCLAPSFVFNLFLSIAFTLTLSSNAAAVHSNSINEIDVIVYDNEPIGTGGPGNVSNSEEEEYFRNNWCVGEENTHLKQHDENQEGVIHVPIDCCIETENDARHYAQELNRGLDSLNTRLDTLRGSGLSEMHDIPTSLSSKIPVVGFEMEVGASSAEFFSFLTGKEGCTFLDPDADPDDFGKPLLGPFPLRKGDQTSHSQIEYSSINYLHRDFVVLNSRDFVKRRFMTASARFSGIPGSSGVNSGESSQRSKLGRLRIPIIGFYEVKPIDNQRCALRVFQWIDLGGAFPAYISRFGNKDCLSKLQKKINERFPVST